MKTLYTIWFILNMLAYTITLVNDKEDISFLLFSILFAVLYAIELLKEKEK